MERSDRDLLCGGVAAFIRPDKSAQRMKDLESKCLENITYEVTLNKQTWSILCVYRPPSMKNSELYKITNTLDKCSSNYDRFFVIGDFTMI